MKRSSIFILGLGVMLLGSSFAFSADLVIERGGQRLVEHGVPDQSCSGTAYSPMVIEDLLPSIPDHNNVMYSMGGAFVDPCTGVDFMSPERFGDRIWYQYQQADESWSKGEPFSARPVIDRSSFSWMQDAGYMKAHPESYIGHTGSASVVKVGKRYFMAFAASIDDQNLCAAEHPGKGTPCGSCLKPWSFFGGFWAVSDDGFQWRVDEGSVPARRSNRALNAAKIWIAPHSWDPVLYTSFKGITRTSMVVHEEGGKTFFYVGAYLWGSFRLKTLMVRMQYDAGSANGLVGDPEVYDTGTRSWVRCIGGEIPPWFNDHSNRGSILGAQLGTISRTDNFPGYQYIQTTPADSMRPASPAEYGVGNVISYRLSEDLLHWTAPSVIPSRIRFFADGSGYDFSVIDPIYVEGADGSFQFFFASADGDARGRGRDGVHDCDIGGKEGTAPFIGLGIYAGGNKKPLRPTGATSAGGKQVDH